MERKIFNERGFFTKDGKAFIDDGFAKELKRVLSTATNQNDVLIISGLLKGMVADLASEKAKSFQ